MKPTMNTTNKDIRKQVTQVALYQRVRNTLLRQDMFLFTRKNAALGPYWVEDANGKCVSKNKPSLEAVAREFDVLKEWERLV